MTARFFAAPLCLALALAGSALPAGAALFGGRSGARSSPDYAREVLPLLDRYCFDCHGRGKSKGDITLEPLKEEAAALADPRTWEKVQQNLRAHAMPPDNKPQPTPAERDRILKWIDQRVFAFDCDHPDPGRVTIRRLNRTEYNNTIRDLVGVDFQPADDFPADDSGYGFDNIGDVLSVPPVLLERYLAAAERILDAAIVTPEALRPVTRRYEAGPLPGSAPGEPVDHGGRQLAREGDIYVQHNFPRAGEYVLRARAYGEQAGAEVVRMGFRLGGKDVQVFEVPATQASPQTYEARVRAEAGSLRFSAAYLNNFVDRARRLDRNLVIEWLEVSGPLESGAAAWPETHRRLFPRPAVPADAAGRRAYAREIVERFATRAWRRPVAAEDVSRLLTLVEGALRGGDSFERSVQVALSAVLVSPRFLFRGEVQPNPNNPAAVHPVDEYALASRLSYFLWSSMPDDELFALAGRGKLRRNLEGQVRRMLRDPKAQALVENFGGQWLQLRNLRLATPDPKAFPGYDDALRAALPQETEMFFEHLIRQDRSVLDFLEADYTFVNERLARHYGMAGVRGEEFRKVSLKGTGRAGVLTHASVLTLTSNPTRTSPVKRGKYVLDNILGTPPPPAPPNVPELKEQELTGSLRQRMEQHRENPTCASCHDRMDPIGFGFEHFDAIGARREKDGPHEIDSSGKLVSGEAFDGAASLTRILLREKRDEFVRCLSEKMLTYALGRGTDFFDKCALDEIGRGLARKDYRFSALIVEIVRSVPFQQARGEVDKSTLSAGPP
ncbi:MAG: hypothetical protein RJA22_2265 [Verrucomicrobiota bacterium]|jgi:hypothetical protein